MKIEKHTYLQPCIKGNYEISSAQEISLQQKKKARKDPQNPMSKGQILLMNPEVQEDFH